MKSVQTHWQKVYTEKSEKSVSWFQAEPGISRSLIDKYVPDKQSRIIDAGAGASVLVDRLLQDGYSAVSCLDLSEQALTISQNRLGKAADNVSWFVIDVTEFAATEAFALWHDRAVFHFLTSRAEQQAYRQVLRNNVAAGGIVMLATFAPDGPEKCSGLPIMRYDRERISSVLGDDFEWLETINERHVTPFETTQAFNYFVFRYSPIEE